MVAIDRAISGYAVVDLGVFLDTDDVGEVDIQQVSQMSRLKVVKPIQELRLKAVG